jgi:hypothetical protein
VNIDGFLGDFCDFNIQLSSLPIGFPYGMTVEDILPISLHLNDSVVNIQVKGSQESLNQIKNLEVFRLYSRDAHSVHTKSHYLKTIPIERNAAGNLVDSYNFYDTLSEKGRYQYQIMSENFDGERSLLLDENVKYFGIYPSIVHQPTNKDKLISISLESTRRRLSLDVYVYDFLTNKLLLYKMVEFKKDESKIILLNVTNYVLKGMNNFLVKVVDQKDSSMKQYVFFTDEDGNIVLKK